MASNRIREDRKEKLVLLDCNAIMMLFEFSINLEDELQRLIGFYKIKIPISVQKELNILAEKGKNKQKKIAKPALKLIKKY